MNHYYRCMSFECIGLWMNELLIGGMQCNIQNYTIDIGIKGSTNLVP